MKNLISKELLSEVLEVNVLDDSQLLLNDIEYEFKEHSGIYIHKKSINIYELAHKCKEWAYKQSSHSMGYAIKTVHYGDSVIGSLVGFKESYIDNCKTEYELVFKLCQWILDNKESK